MICALSILGFITPLLVPCPPTPPPPWYQQPPAYQQQPRRYERPVPPPRPKPEIQPDEYRGSDDEAMGAPQAAALHRVEMDAADHWAIYNLKFPELPPVEFDHAYKGALWITDLDSEAELRRICGQEKATGVVVGCARQTQDGAACQVYLGPRPAWAGVTRNIVLRHELGHCNGWGKDHAGMR